LTYPLFWSQPISGLYNGSLRTGIAAGGEFIVRPARNRCPIENIKLKLTTKSQIETRLTELKYSDANSRSFNVQPHLQQYQCWL